MLTVYYATGQTIYACCLRILRLVPGNQFLQPTAGPKGLTVLVPQLDLHCCLVVAEL